MSGGRLCPGSNTCLLYTSLDIVSQRLVGDNRHLSLKVRHHGEDISAIWFGRTEPVKSGSTLAYRMGSDEYKGQARIQFFIEGAAD